MAGGIIPLSPYMIRASVPQALAISVGVTILALLLFGYVKGRFTGAGPLRSAFQTALIGGLAAGAAFAIARAIS
jgi:VIT1/CCC1 family predicted Fe2+/Mn2+ transporter